MCVVLCALPVTHVLAAQSSSLAPDSSRRVSFETDEGTWMSLDISPDGKTMVFDLLGDIYTLPVGGGVAVPIRRNSAWNQMPRYSPDGRHIAFVSDQDGSSANVWVMATDGSVAHQVTHDRDRQLRTPRWMTDGTIVLSAQATSGVWEIWKTDALNAADPTPVVLDAGALDPAPSADGRGLFFTAWSHETGYSRIRYQSFAGPIDSAMWASAPEDSSGGCPEPSPDGRWLAYFRDHGPHRTLHVRDLRTGTDRMLLGHAAAALNDEFAEQCPEYAFFPDSRSVILESQGKIHRIGVPDGSDRVIPFIARVVKDVPARPIISRRVDDSLLTARAIGWPSYTRDGRRVAFTALGHLYAMMLPHGRPHRLTASPDREYMPAVSPDGRWVAYVSWSDTTRAALRVVPIGGGATRTIATAQSWYANPAWSPDGTKLVVVHAAGGDQLPVPNGDSLELEWIAAAGGLPHRIMRLPYGLQMLWIAPRSPRPAFTADGRRVLVSRWNGRDPNEGGSTSLWTVTLDGSDQREILRSPGMAEVALAPDGRHAAFSWRWSVLVASLPDSVRGSAAGPVRVRFPDGLTPPDSGIAMILNARTLPMGSSPGGIFVGWRGSSTVTWLWTNGLYEARLGAGGGHRVGDVRVVVARPRPAGRIVFTNARVVTMRGDTVFEHGTVVVDGNRIRAVGPTGTVAAPPDATVFDIAGATLVPGLIDVHAHPADKWYDVHPQLNWQYVELLANGVTTSFDPSAPTVNTFAEAELVETGSTVGPRIYSTGDAIHPDAVVDERIESLADAQRVARRRRTYGAVMLKEYDLPRRDERQWLLQAAKQEGIEITAEGGGRLARDLTRVVDGYTAFEHNLPVEIFGDVVHLLAATGVVYTPTVVDGSYGTVKGIDSASDHDPAKLLLRGRPTVCYDNVAKLRRFDRPTRDHLPWETAWDWCDLNIDELTWAHGAAAIVHAGGALAAGSHTWGRGVARVLDVLVAGGVTPLEALRAATLGGAQKVGLDRDLGSLVPGKLADLLVLDANPLDDIANIQRIRYVVKNGVVYDAESMAELWPDRRPLGRFYWETEQQRRRYAPGGAGIDKLHICLNNRTSATRQGGRPSGRC